MQVNNSKLVVVNIGDNVKERAGKKFALTLGIKTAKYDYIVLSDADCQANSKHWLKRIADNFSTKDIVLGLGPSYIPSVFAFTSEERHQI